MRYQDEESAWLKRGVRLMLAAGFFFVVPLSAGAEPVQKAPLPAPAAQEESLKQIRDIFKDEYEVATSADSKAALAKKLLEQAVSTSDDIPGKFALITEAREMATSAGDFPLGLEATDALLDAFDADEFQLKTEILIAASKANRAANVDQKWLAETTMTLSEGAIEAENFAAAKQLASIALATARKIRDNGLVKAATQRVSEVQSLEKAFDAVKDARKTLADNPTEPAANLEVGRFQVLARGDWEAGLPMLALGSDEKLRELAAKDVTNPEDPNERVALADAWWAYSATGKAINKERSRERAIHWYTQALPDLTGLSRVKAEKRIGESDGGPANDINKNKERQRTTAKGKAPPLRIPHKVGEIRRIEGVKGSMDCLAFSRDGRLLLSGAGIWETETGMPIDAEARLGGVGSFSVDGKLALICGQDGKVILRDVASRQDLASFKGHTGRVTSAAFSADEKRAVSGGHDGVVCIWDLKTGAELRHFGGDTSEVWGVAFSPDGKYIVSTARDQKEYKTARLWDTKTGQETRRFSKRSDSPYGYPVFSSDGSRVACGNGNTAWVWDTNSGSQVARFDAKKPSGGSIGLRMVALTADGRRLLKATYDRTIELIGIPDGEIIETFQGHAGVPSSIAISPDGRFFASASQEDDTIRLWGLPK